MDKGSQIIISADRAPMKLDRVQDRIKSRLAGGLVVDIDVPELELKVKILRKKLRKFKVSSKKTFIWMMKLLITLRAKAKLI